MLWRRATLQGRQGKMVNIDAVNRGNLEGIDLLPLNSLNALADDEIVGCRF